MAEDKKKKIIGIIILAALAALMIVLFFTVGQSLIRFVSDSEAFRAWVSEKGFWGKILFLGIIIFQVVIAIIPGEPFEIASGYAFGYLEGTLLCIIGAFIGSIIVFYLVKKYGMRIVEIFFTDEQIDSLGFLKNSEKRNIIFFILFFIPGTPKDLLSYFAGLTDMSWGLWIFMCSVGRIPSIITSAVGGDAIGSKNYVFAVFVFLITAAISAGGFLIYKYLGKKKE